MGDIKNKAKDKCPTDLPLCALVSEQTQQVYWLSMARPLKPQFHVLKNTETQRKGAQTDANDMTNKHGNART